VKLFILACLLVLFAGVKFDQWVYENTRPEPEKKPKREEELWPDIRHCKDDLWDCIRYVEK